MQPRLIYCYKSVIESLHEMLKQKGFHDNCEMWRKRDSNVIYRDVYDGQVWNDFLNPDGIPFLSVAYNYAFQLMVPAI